MCLDNPQKLSGFKYWLNQYLPYKGWKVVIHDKTDNSIQSLVRQTTYQFNKYHNSESGRIAAFRSTGPTTTYPNGFHVFPKKEDAETYLRQHLPEGSDHKKYILPVLVQVKYKNAHTKGEEGIQNLNTIVTKQIKFVKEPISTKDKLIIAAFGLAALLTPALIFLIAWIIECA